MNDFEGLSKYLLSILDVNIDENCQYENEEDRQEIFNGMERLILYDGNDIDTAQMMGVPRSKVEEFIKEKGRIDEFYN